jgi:hypothetical protein
MNKGLRKHLEQEHPEKLQKMFDKQSCKPKIPMTPKAQSQPTILPNVIQQPPRPPSRGPVGFKTKDEVKTFNKDIDPNPPAHVPKRPGPSAIRRRGSDFEVPVLGNQYNLDSLAHDHLLSDGRTLDCGYNPNVRMPLCKPSFRTPPCPSRAFEKPISNGRYTMACTWCFKLFFMSDTQRYIDHITKHINARHGMNAVAARHHFKPEDLVAYTSSKPDQKMTRHLLDNKPFATSPLYNKSELEAEIADAMRQTTIEPTLEQTMRENFITLK